MKHWKYVALIFVMWAIYYIVFYALFGKAGLKPLTVGLLSYFIGVFSARVKVNYKN
jgi:hypothetical protein